MSGTPPTPARCPDWAARWALFLDIDGTLLDLAPTPAGVRVPPGLPASLRAIARGLGGSLALVSGRPLGEIDRLMPGNFDAAGTHGSEWRIGGRPMDPGPDRGAELAAVAARLQTLVQGMAGVLLERKPQALAIHYRLAPERQEVVRSLAGQAQAALGAGFRLLAGKAVVEILPTQAGKGAAIRRFMARSPYAGRTPVFVGDDVTDEDGFAAVNALAGYSIRVGEGAGTAARYRLSSPSAVRHWLAGLVAGLGPDALREPP